MVVFEKMWLYSGESGCIREKRFHSGKVVAVGESASIRANMVVFGQRYFSLGKVVDLGGK